MKIIYSQRHLSHSPLYEIFNGHADPHAEVPSRVENIKKALITNGYKISSLSKTAPISLIKRVHDKKYLEFGQKEKVQIVTAATKELADRLLERIKT